MPLHLCLLGDATSPHIQRWAREMLQRGYRVSLITARPAPLDGVDVRAIRHVRPQSLTLSWHGNLFTLRLPALPP